MATETPAAGPPRSLSRRMWPVAVLAVAVLAFFALRLDRYVTLDALRENRAVLKQVVARNGTLAPIAYMLVYAAIVALSLPGGAVLTLAGGFLFGALAGTGAAVVAATAGATIVFLIARGAFGDLLRRRAGPFLRRMEAGFQDNALCYLLVLRLVPAFPFWAVNLVPALVGVPLPTFVAATFVGIIPATFVFASFGAGLGAIFDSGAEVRLGAILTPQVVIALIGLAILALLPVAVKRWKARPR